MLEPTWKLLIILITDLGVCCYNTPVQS